MGALTSKPYAFTARPWELSEHESIDIFDPFGSSVKLSLRGGEVIRVLPNVRFALFDEWISDSSRFSYDSVLSESRSKFIGMRFTAADGLKNIFFSNLWFSRFLEFRLGSSFVPDHFCLSYVNTIRFFSNFFGFSKFSTGDSGLSDIRFFPAHQLSEFYSALNGGITHLFLFNLNLRYLFPTLSIRLRQAIFAVRGPTNIFNVSSTTNNLLGETNLTYGPKSLVCSFRRKSRVSRLFSSLNSYALLDLSTFDFFCGYVSSLKIRYSVFHQSPRSVSYSEFGINTTLQSQFFTYTHHYADSGFVSAVFLTNFTSSERAFDLILPIPHPYEDVYNYYIGGKSAAFLPAVSSKVSKFFFPFSFKLTYYPTFTPSRFELALYSSILSKKFNTNFSNYVTHFLGSQFQVNSINILLNVKRHNEFRSNYLYYLRPCPVFGLDFAYTFGGGLYNSF
jgi:hypothetical protein